MIKFRVYKVIARPYKNMAFSDCSSVLMRNPAVAVQGLFASKANQIQTIGRMRQKS